jgi:hypothetical protein
MFGGHNQHVPKWRHGQLVQPCDENARYNRDPKSTHAANAMKATHDFRLAFSQGDHLVKHTSWSRAGGQE